VPLTEVHEVSQDSVNWRNRYRLPPRGVGCLEPEIQDPRSDNTPAYRITKAACQQRPDGFNLRWIAAERQFQSVRLLSRASKPLIAQFPRRADRDAAIYHLRMNRVPSCPTPGWAVAAFFALCTSAALQIRDSGWALASPLSEEQIARRLCLSISGAPGSR
jgi:hypothetical protein